MIDIAIFNSDIINIKFQRYSTKNDGDALC